MRISSEWLIELPTARRRFNQSTGRNAAFRRVLSLGLLISVWGAAALGQDRPTSTAPPEGGGVNPMGAMMNPTEPGRRGPRIFSRTTFDPGHVAWVALAALGTLLVVPGWLFLYRGRMGTPELS